LAPRFHDPSLSGGLSPRYRDLPFYDDLERLLSRERLDMALVTLQNRDAPSAIERLAAARVHLLVDKPAARSAAEARQAFAAVERSGVRASVGLTRHFDRAWLQARELVTTGRLGRLLSAEAVLVTSTVTVRNPANYLFNRELSGHGILLWLGIHGVDGLLWLTGERIVEVQAVIANVGGAPIGVEDAASMTMRFEGGALGFHYLANALPRPANDGYVALRGEHGSLKLAADRVLTWIGPGSRDAPVHTEERHYATARLPGYGPEALLQIRDLLDAIRDGREPRVTGRDLVRALDVIDAAYESAALGRPVQVRSRPSSGPGLRRQHAP
ncbi:MAG: Gfo/Idh/MocA family oxidoreductase, partial [Chloroflexi bacterium]|nr:Gfo/Idh/MocA family oxidoreductase [Chloroflexota bacterium]